MRVETRPPRAQHKQSEGDVVLATKGSLMEEASSVQRSESRVVPSRSVAGQIWLSLNLNYCSDAIDDEGL